MLNVTENAQAVVKGLTTDAGLPDTGGLRIGMTADQSQLEVRLVPEPQPTDQVVATEDAHVYVAEETSQVLDGQTLDASQNEQGIGFTLEPNA